MTLSFLWRNVLHYLWCDGQHGPRRYYSNHTDKLEHMYRGDEYQEGVMTRTLLDKELQELDAQIQRLGTLVDEALGKALEALQTGDLAKAGIVIEADSIIDSLRATVEEHT